MICKMCDFGLAGLLSNEKMKIYCGTFGWQAPEISKNVPCDGSVDIWSLGCILYSLLTAERAFDADDDYDLMWLMEGGWGSGLSTGVIEECG
jgi:serine/threonine protein kinase